jgi:ribosome-associated protein
LIKKPAAKKKKPTGTPAQTLGVAAAEAAFDKKAFDVVVLDVGALSPVTDVMVIASCRSTTHLRAVADNVEAVLLKSGAKASHRERGLGGETDWILLDYFDVMIHLFVNEARAHYQLERLYEGAVTLAQFQ